MRKKLRGIEGENFEKRQSVVSFSGDMFNVLNGIGPKQQLAFASASMYISDIHAEIRNEASVPEPSSLMLRGIGLLGLVLRATKLS